MAVLEFVMFIFRGFILAALASALACSAGNGGSGSAADAANPSAADASYPSAADASSPGDGGPAIGSNDAGLTGVFAASTPGPTNCAMPPDVDGGTLEAIVQGNSTAGIALFAELAHNSGNVFLSPYSVSTAMAMVYQGAEGPTATQMAQYLSFPNVPNDELAAGFGALACEIESNGQAPDGGQIEIANAVFGQQGETFLSPFTMTLEEQFGAPFTPVDFAKNPDDVRQDINGWVSNETDGMIPQLLAPGTVTSDMKLVLVDALYFNEAWETPFDPAMMGTFNLSATSTEQVPMMTGVIMDARYYSDSFVTIAEVPFQNGREAIDFLIPADFPTSVLASSLTPSGLQGWFGDLVTEPVLVTVPKFKMDWSSSLIPAFAAMGLGLPFNSGAADFSGIDGEKDLYISLLQHEAVLNVQESGVTAAAATAVGVAGGAEPQWNATFTADQPFLVIIRDVPTGTLLFLGQVVDPTGG
jgi:serpin B